MKNRDQKKKDFESLRQEFEKTPSLFVTGFEKMTVEQDFQLRKIIRGAGGGYEVVKNTVAGKASKGTPAEGVLGALTGMNSIAFTSADPVALAKILSDYAKGNAGVQLQGRHRGRSRHRCSGYRSLGDNAAEGPDLRPVAVPN